MRCKSFKLQKFVYTRFLHKWCIISTILYWCQNWFFGEDVFHVFVFPKMWPVWCDSYLLWFVVLFLLFTFQISEPKQIGTSTHAITQHTFPRHFPTYGEDVKHESLVRPHGKNELTRIGRSWMGRTARTNRSSGNFIF